MHRRPRRLFLVVATLNLGLIGFPARAQESWDAVYMGGTKIGHTHVWIETLKDKEGHDLVRVRVDTNVRFKRGSDRTKMIFHYGTIERPDGTVLKLDTRTQNTGSQSPSEDIRTFGDVKNEKMELTQEVNRKKTTLVIPWADDVRGPYAAELSLSRSPMKPGDRRELKTFIPVENKILLTKLAAVGVEAIPIGVKGDNRDLLRVEQDVVDDAGKPIPGHKATLWVDATGQILKSHVDMLNMETFRTTKAGALAELGQEFDLLGASMIPTRKIDGSERSREIIYRITTTDEEPSAIFPDDRRQKLTPSAKNVANLVVRTAGPEAGSAESAPGPEYLRSSPLIDCEDAMVLRRMKAAVGKVVDPWDKAVAVEKWVFTNIRDKNFGIAFAPAAQVARDLSGDCTEHSVLVAAMCRAAGVPARCVVGVVYSDQKSAFGPHMWNEVYVNGRWVAIDSAYDESDVDATHLKMGVTSLDGVTPFDAFLPVLNVFGKMKIEPLEVR